MTEIYDAACIVAFKRLKICQSIICFRIQCD
uniref:Uncharacterized protein n=1 Tax=Arundo donax TaxID=35708 RepID=A0A0A8Z8T2_ARUDO